MKLDADYPDSLTRCGSHGPLNDGFHFSTVFQSLGDSSALRERLGAVDSLEDVSVKRGHKCRWLPRGKKHIKQDSLDYVIRCFKERYVEKPETGCWIWTGSTCRGYGQFLYGVERRAARVAWVLFVGPIPDGKWVLHNCPGGDNRACVNPAHLFLGSPLDNMRDAKQKGTLRKGEECHCAKKTEDQVRRIRELRLEGKTMTAIAAEYGLDPTAVKNIVTGHTWGHLWGDTQAEYDALIAKQHFNCGEKRPNAKRTETDIREIRKRYLNGEGVGAIARSLGTYHSIIYKIVTRQIWKHVQ